MHIIQDHCLPSLFTKCCQNIFVPVNKLFNFNRNVHWVHPLSRSDPYPCPGLILTPVQARFTPYPGLILTPVEARYSARTSFVINNRKLFIIMKTSMFCWLFQCISRMACQQTNSCGCQQYTLASIPKINDLFVQSFDICGHNMPPCWTQHVQVHTKANGEYGDFQYCASNTKIVRTNWVLHIL